MSYKAENNSLVMFIQQCIATYNDFFVLHLWFFTYEKLKFL